MARRNWSLLLSVGVIGWSVTDVELTLTQVEDHARIATGVSAIFRLLKKFSFE
jgi:hypothetical protein